jgi:hypothetical protein
MKKVLFSIVIMVVSVSMVQAATFSFTGSVKTIRTHDIKFGENVSWITLEGFTSAGTCKTRGNGHVLVRLKNDETGKRAYSAALSAKMASKTITVYVDDTQKDIDGIFLLEYIDV